MRVNTKCSVALHCLVFVAILGEKKKVTGEMLAFSTGSNPVIIRNILSALQRSGFITVARGVGGAKLSRPPEQISIWDVYQAVENSDLENLIGIHPHPSPLCPVGCQIDTILAGPYEEITDAVREQMKKITLSQLLARFDPSVVERLAAGRMEASQS